MTRVDTICVLAGAYAGEYSFTELVDGCDEVSSKITLPGDAVTDLRNLPSATVRAELSSLAILHDEATALTADIFHPIML